MGVTIREARIIATIITVLKGNLFIAIIRGLVFPDSNITNLPLEPFCIILLQNTRVHPP